MFLPGVGTAAGGLIKLAVVGARLVHFGAKMTRGMSLVNRVRTVSQATKVVRASMKWKAGKIVKTGRHSQPTIRASYRSTQIAARSLMQRGPKVTSLNSRSGRGVNAYNRGGWSFHSYPRGGYSVIGYQGRGRGIHIAH